MAKHYDVIIKVIEVDNGVPLSGIRHETAPAKRDVRETVSLAVKAVSKDAAIDKVIKLLEVERGDSSAE